MDITILWHILTVTANALGAIVWYMIIENRKDIHQLQKDMAELKFNYLDRFDDIKECLNKFELNIMQRITILETKICKDK